MCRDVSLMQLEGLTLSASVLQALQAVDLLQELILTEQLRIECRGKFKSKTD